MNEILKNNPELGEKVKAEFRRIAESGDATDAREGFKEIIKKVMDIDLSEDDLKTIFSNGVMELDLEDLTDVSGGINKLGDYVDGVVENSDVVVAGMKVAWKRLTKATDTE